VSDDDEERQLKIELMTVQIDQGRLNIDKMRQEMRLETRKFVLQAIAALAASVAAGAAALGLILHWMGKL
jgi:hypothetical protein